MKKLFQITSLVALLLFVSRCHGDQIIGSAPGNFVRDVTNDVLGNSFPTTFRLGNNPTRRNDRVHILRELNDLPFSGGFPVDVDYLNHPQLTNILFIDQAQLPTNHSINSSQVGTFSSWYVHVHGTGANNEFAVFPPVPDFARVQFEDQIVAVIVLGDRFRDFDSRFSAQIGATIGRPFDSFYPPRAENDLDFELVPGGSGRDRFRLVDPFTIEFRCRSRNRIDAMRIITAKLHPDANISGPNQVNEGQSITLSAANSTHPVEPTGQLNFNWDFDDDGQFDDASGQTVVFSAANIDGPATRQIGLQATDSFGCTDTTSMDVTIRNVVPTASIAGPNVTSEGRLLPLSASATDPNPSDQANLIFRWDLDGDGIFGEQGSGATNGDEVGPNPTFDARLIDGFRNVAIGLRVFDEEQSPTVTSTVTVNNVIPEAVPGGPYTVNEGGEVVLMGNGNDPNPQDQSTLQYLWDLDGDNIFGEVGNAAENGNENIRNPVFDAFELDGPDSFTIRLRVQDEELSPPQNAVVNIVNVVPTVDCGGPYAVNEGAKVTLNGSATDPGIVDSMNLILRWDLDGDGNFGETGAAAGNGDEIGSNPMFDAGGLFGPDTVTIQLEASDPDNRRSIASCEVVIVDLPFLLGDINLDGDVNLLDVQPFVDLLQSGEFQIEGDFTGDGVVNLLDVNGFVQLLTNECG